MRGPRVNRVARLAGIATCGLVCSWLAAGCGGETSRDGRAASAGGTPSAGAVASVGGGFGGAGSNDSASGGIAGEAQTGRGGSGHAASGGQGGAADVVEVVFPTVMEIGGETLPESRVELTASHSWDIGGDLIDSYLTFFWDYDDPAQEGEEQSVRIALGLPSVMNVTYEYPGSYLEWGLATWFTSGVITTSTQLTATRAVLALHHEDGVLSGTAEFELTSSEDRPGTVFVQGPFETPAP